MGRLSIHGVHKSFGKVQALKGIDLEIGDGEFCVFVGPSGCGKSTLLRSIAGLEDIDDGTISIDGTEVSGLRPRDRNVAMVFQNYALYPYLNVFENIAFGLRARKAPDSEVNRKVQEAAETLHISRLLERYPRELSGGQRQRVAIGRAIVREARIFLFDEPLSNLDAQLRDGMRAEIKRLHQEIGKTTIYVTHDQIEAMTLADRIVLLRDGQIEQSGEPLDLFERPATRFVAGFLGSPQMNFIPCKLERDDTGFKTTFTDGRRLPLGDATSNGLEAFVGRDLFFGVRPEHMIRAVDAGADRDGLAPLTVEIDLVQPTGTRTYAQFRFAGEEATVELPAHSVEQPGTSLDLLVNMRRTVLIDPESDRVVQNAQDGS